MTDTYGLGKPCPAYDERDLEAAYAVIDLAGASPTLLAREIAGAVAGARRDGGREALAALQAHPAARTTWRLRPEAFSARDIECVEVPKAALEETSPLG